MDITDNSINFLVVKTGRGLRCRFNKGSGLDSGQVQDPGPDYDKTLKMPQKSKNQVRFIGLSALVWG